jgi:hypothetical protein
MTATGFPAAGYASPYSVYTPNVEASGGLVVGYSRNMNDFPVNNYIELFASKEMFGLYWQWTSRNAARILSATDREHVWADGDPRPPGLGNTESFITQSYKTTRRAYTFSLGEMTVEQMSFDLLMANSNDMGQQMMTARTMLVQSALAAANWGTNTAAVNGQILTTGQTWATGSTGMVQTNTNPVGTLSTQGANILQSLQYGIRTVHQQTIGSVGVDKLVLVINPVTAQAMAASTEVRDYIKQSVYALAQLRGDVYNQNGIWGLPTHIYGVRIIVEDAVRVSTNVGAANDVLGYVMPTGVAYLLAAPSSLVGLVGSRSFSTVQTFFWRDEATVEVMHDVINKRFMGSLISNYVPVIASTLSGFYFTACI